VVGKATKESIGRDRGRTIILDRSIDPLGYSKGC